MSVQREDGESWRDAIQRCALDDGVVEQALDMFDFLVDDGVADVTAARYVANDLALGKVLE
jgi:hypothetical protein